MDAVVADFEAGAAEMLSPDAAPDHWDVIEGQGSLFHPAYAGVSLGLLHGSQPDVFVVCHDPARERVIGYPDYPLPRIPETIELTVQLGRTHQPRDPLRRCLPQHLGTCARGGARTAGARERPARPAGGGSDACRGAEFERLVDSCLA